ncbi:GNAT family N-acetyltransferase [Actinoplanes bogorensis]|uniref:GNAT family N-acetyltransferase n=1 Tax=Paractinoplanes bogorensis TaxID=1610840 RepID=A0ABS5YPW7_9ACTN|nr:GNAT family N-acetyltransferase [Actinoplanes bogorensis]MBU2665371.1 GNAT family N-acetyltransferase [Actinoplanes bogorensis]
MLIRDAGPNDLPFLKLIVLEAYNWDGPRFTLDQILADDHARRYLDGFPGPGDLGVIAMDEARPVGAVWGRALPADRAGYGFVAAEIPELTAGVLPDARGRGIATALLDAVIGVARERGLPALSLSVEDGNSARRLYERAGFEVVGRNGGSDTMLLRLS